MSESISKSDYVWALNEWWRRFRDEPDRFQREFQTIMELEAAESENREPTMGDEGWRYVHQLLAERDAAAEPKGA